MANKKKKCGYSIDVMYDEINNAIRNVEITADGLVTGLPRISKSRDFNNEFDNEATINLNNLLHFIHIADLNQLYSLRITIYKDDSILERTILKEFKFSILEPLYKKTLGKGEEFITIKEDIEKIYKSIYPSIIRKGGNKYLLREFSKVIAKAISYIVNMKLKDILNPDIMIQINHNYDDSILNNKYNFNKRSRNIKRYRLESFVKRYITNP